MKYRMRLNGNVIPIIDGAETISRTTIAGVEGRTFSARVDPNEISCDAVAEMLPEDGEELDFHIINEDGKVVFTPQEYKSLQLIHRFDEYRGETITLNFFEPKDTVNEG